MTDPGLTEREALAAQVAALARQLDEVSAQLQRISRALGPSALPSTPSGAEAGSGSGSGSGAGIGPGAGPETRPETGAATGAAAFATAGADPRTEIRALLGAAFAVALQTDATDSTALRDSLEAFRPLVHSARHGTPLLDSELLAYKWKPWVQRARQYLLKPDDPTSFEIVQWQPPEPDANTQQIKVFLRAERRMPTPVTLRRDPAEGGALRIEATSL